MHKVNSCVLFCFVLSHCFPILVQGSEVKSLSRVWLCNPMDCSPPGSSVCEISQARILEWFVISFSRGSSWPRDQTHISCIACKFFSPRMIKLNKYSTNSTFSMSVLVWLSLLFFSLLFPFLIDLSGLFWPRYTQSGLFRYQLGMHQIREKSEGKICQSGW